MSFNYNNFKKSYENIKKFGFSKKKRDKINDYNELLNKFESNDVQIEYKKTLKYIHSIITKNNLWTKKPIKPDEILGTFLSTYLMENHSNKIYEYRTGLINIVFAAQKLLDIFDKLSLFKDENLLIESDLLSLYVDNLYEYINLEKIFKSQDYNSEKKGYITTLDSIVEELNNKITNPYKSIKRYKLLAQLDLFRNKLINIKCYDIIYKFDSKYSELLLEINNAANNDFFSIGLEPVSNELTFHEILIDPGYNAQIDDDNDPNKSILQKTFLENLQKEILNNPPIYERTINALYKIKKSIIEVSNSSKLKLDKVINNNVIFQFEKGIYKYEDFIIISSNIINIICDIEEYEEKIETNQLWLLFKNNLEVADYLIYSKKIYLLLQFILTQVNNLRIYFKNKKIKLLKSITENNINYLITYETNNFKIDNIKKTQTWLKNILISNPELIKNDDRKKIIILALVNISSDYKGVDCPETLLLDKKRLYNLTMDFNKYILISEIILITRKYLSDKNIINKIIKVLLKLNIYNDNFIQKSVIIISTIINSKYLIDIEIEINNFILNKDNTIKKFLSEIWYKAIEGTNIELSNTKKIVDEFTESDLFEPLWPNIVNSITLLNKIAQINILVHGKLYESIIKKIIIIN